MFRIVVTRNGDTGWLVCATDVNLRTTYAMTMKRDNASVFRSSRLFDHVLQQAAARFDSAKIAAGG